MGFDLSAFRKMMTQVQVKAKSQMLVLAENIVKQIQTDFMNKVQLHVSIGAMSHSDAREAEDYINSIKVSQSQDGTIIIGTTGSNTITGANNEATQRKFEYGTSESGMIPHIRTLELDELVAEMNAKLQSDIDALQRSASDHTSQE
jgi:hypothetical protein